MSKINEADLVVQWADFQLALQACGLTHMHIYTCIHAYTNPYIHTGCC